MSNNPMNYEKFKNKYIEFWINKGCLHLDSHDYIMGAATFHPVFVFNCLSNKNIPLVYTQLSRRNPDGRYGKSPIRLYKHTQIQIVLFENAMDLYLESLIYMGFDFEKIDIRFVENNWSSYSIGGVGYGWEIWLNILEVTQFTYFDKIANIKLETVPCELAVGIERLYLIYSNKMSFYDFNWNKSITYKDVRQEEERQFTEYYNNHAPLIDKNYLFNTINTLVEKKLYYPAYELFLELNDWFNTQISRQYIDKNQRKILLNNIKNTMEYIGKNFQKDFNDGLINT